MVEPPSTTIIIDEEDVEVLTNGIAPSADGPPIGQVIELPKPVNYISDRMFEAAGGAPSDTTKYSREKKLEEISRVYGLKFANPGSLSESVVTSMYSLLIEGISIADDDQLKQALVLLLPVMHDKYASAEELQKVKPRVLFNMYRHELERRGKIELAAKLGASSSRTSPPPLPPPSSSKKK